jgi:5'-nucleotidase
VYRVTVNSYLASGGDRFTVLNQGTHSIGGGQDIDALGAYLAQFRAPQPPYDPGAANLPGAARITRLP